MHRDDFSKRGMASSVQTRLPFEVNDAHVLLLDVQGRARRAMGDLDGAEEALRSAMSTALALGAVPARLRAATHLAQLLKDDGRVRPARDLLDKTLRAIDKKAPFSGLHRALQLMEGLAT